MNLPDVVKVRCNWCSRQKPSHQVHRLASKQVICEYCLDWHFHALEFLGGAAPRGCQECGASWADLNARAEAMGAGEVRMYVAPKDGINALLCASCIAPYLPKRADLYRGTEFGRNALKL